MTSTSDCADNKDILHPAMKKLRTPGISKETILKEYEDWANTYDSVTLSRGYKAPDLAVHYLSDSFPKDIRSEKKIIDVGAGTGLAARRLQAEGFRHIDALDASEAMMNVAMENNLYEKYFCEFIGATPLPIETGTYDGLTAVACISSTHIKPDAFAELVRIVKPGGIVVFVARSGAIHSSQTFTDWFYSSIDKLEKEGKWKKLVETTGCYLTNEEARLFKFQVL